jgi:hypothetical protein
MILHDFSGVQIGDIFEYFKTDLYNHMDHIIYGLGMTKSSSCYPHLDNQLYDFYYIETNDSIKIFNPDAMKSYNDIVLFCNNISSNDVSKITERNTQIIMFQINKMIDNDKRIILVILPAILKKIYMNKIDFIDHNEYNFIKLRCTNDLLFDKNNIYDIVCKIYMNEIQRIEHFYNIDFNKNQCCEFLKLYQINDLMKDIKNLFSICNNFF